LESPRKPIDDSSDLVATIGWLTIVLAFSLPLYRPWLTLAASLVMILWFFGGDLRSRLARLRHHRMTIAILVFLALNVASLAWSSDPKEGLRYLAKYRYLLFVPMLATAIPRRYRLRVAAAYEVGAIASVALSAAVVLGILRVGNAHPGNPSATMAHLDYTLILAIASLLALTHVLYGAATNIQRLVWLAASGVAAAGLLINIGRSGQLGFIAGLTVLMLRWAFDASRRQFVATVALLAAVGILVMGTSPPALQRMIEAGHEVREAIVEHDFEGNVGGRLAAFAVAGRIISEDPVLGAGAGGNMQRFREILDTDLPRLKPAIYWYRHFHNQYAQIGSELGVAGLASLIWIFWVLVRGPYRSLEARTAAWVLAAIYLVGFLGEPFLHKQIPLIAFALFAGLITGTQLDEQEDPEEE
jgi:O-antigen ligase